MATDAFPALRALTEALLTRADADYLRRQVDAAVKVMAEHGCAPPTTWPDETFGVAVWGTKANTTPEGRAATGALQGFRAVAPQSSVEIEISPVVRTKTYGVVLELTGKWMREWHEANPAESHVDFLFKVDGESFEVTFAAFKAALRAAHAAPQQAQQPAED